MKIHIFKLILVLLMIGCFASQVFSMAEKPKSFQITGTISEVNSRNLTITLSPKAGELLEIAINNNTVITKGGKNITLSAIKKGDSATVTYEIRRRKKIAKSINIKEQTQPRKKPVSTKGKK